MTPSDSTDRRLDELASAVDSGFARVDADIRELRGEIGGLKKTLLGGAIAIIVALIGLAASLAHWPPG